MPLHWKSRHDSSPTLTPLWEGMRSAQHIVEAGSTSRLANMLRQLADKMEKEADFMESVHDQSELLAMRCQRLQKLCESQQRKLWAGMGHGAPSSLTYVKGQDHLIAANSAGIKEASNENVHLQLKWEKTQNARPAPIQVPDPDEHLGSLQDPSPLSSMDTAVNTCSPQELDPQMMLCNPLYSMASLSLRGTAPEPTSESSFQEAASTSAPTSQLRPEVSLCSSPAGADLKQQQLQQPLKNARLSQLASQKSWPPELAPSRDAAATSHKEAAAVAPEKQVTAHGRHVATPSDGESSQWFGAAAGHAAGSCVSSPRPAAPLQTLQGTQSRDARATAHAPMAPQLARTSGDAEENNQALQDSDSAGLSTSEYASSEVTASEVLDAASVMGPMTGQARSKRPWQPRPPPPPSSCASNRPQKSSGPFFPPAARFAPSPSSRMAAALNFADEEVRQCGSDIDDASSGQPQQKDIRVANVEANIAWDAEEEVDVGAGEACSSQQHVQGMESHSPGTMIVKIDLATASTEACRAWEAEDQQGRLPRLQKENSNSPEQRPVQGRAKLARPGTAEARPTQQPVSPLRERNSPDAAARLDSPAARLAAADPGMGGCRLNEPGPLAASSPALVRNANRLLRSLPAEPASLHTAPRPFTQTGTIPDEEVSLASPLWRSMQHIQLHTAKGLLHSSERVEAQPEGRINESGKREEPDTLAVLRASGILQRDGPLAASRAAAVKRASEPARPVSLLRPHPADLEAAERLRASLSSEGSGASRASAAPSSVDAGGRGGRPPKPERASQEELPLRASGSTQAPRTPKHAPRPSTIPDSPLTSTSDVAYEHGSIGLAAGWNTPARPVMAAGEKQPPPTVPKHLATPSLMLRAGDAAVYDEPEVDRITPRGNPPPHASAGSLPAGVHDEGLHPIKTIAAPEHLPPKSSLADEGESARMPSEADEAAPRVKPQLPPHLRGTFSPGCTKSGPGPVAARFDALLAPEPRTDKDMVPPHQAAADTALTIQDNKPDRLGVSAAGLAAAAARMKRVSAPPPPPPPPPPPAPKGQALKQTAATMKPPRPAPVDAREAMLRAIKNGQFKLRKTPHQSKGEAAGVAAGAEQKACTPAMAAVMERARAMRATTYPESSVNGSSASSWGS
ncbi:g1669 [Coccomyxa elongata]